MSGMDVFVWCAFVSALYFLSAFTQKEKRLHYWALMALALAAVWGREIEKFCLTTEKVEEFVRLGVGEYVCDYKGNKSFRFFPEYKEKMEKK